MIRPQDRLRLVAVSFALGLLWSAGAAAQPADSPWPEFQHDAQNTGRSDEFTGPETMPSIVWQQNHASPRRAAPALAEDGTIYLGVGRFPLLAIDPASGLGVWATGPGNATALDRSSPAVAADGTVYFGDRSNDLWSVDPSILTPAIPYPIADLNWRFSVPTDGDVSTPPTIGPDGRVYMASDALATGKFYAMNPNGTPSWDVKLGGAPINTSAALSHDGTVVYTVTGGRRLHALSTANGADVFPPYIAQPAATGSRAFNFSPVVGTAGTIYVAARGVVVAVNPNGTLKWSFDPGLQFGSPVALAADGDLSGLEDAVYVTGYTRTATLYALNPTNGTVLWEKPLLGRAKARNVPPIVDASGNIFAAVGQFLYAFDSAGNSLWNLPFRFQFLSSPIIGGEGVLYVGNGRTLYKLSN
jgi:outer membrane protein assembly factor BamB